MPGLDLKWKSNTLFHADTSGGGPEGGMQSAVRRGWRDQTGTRRTKAATVRDLGAGAG